MRIWNTEGSLITLLIIRGPGVNQQGSQRAGIFSGISRQLSIEIRGWIVFKCPMLCWVIIFPGIVLYSRTCISTQLRYGVVTGHTVMNLPRIT
ncbi:hypothetical protein BDW62DRAFT_19476 [Aspergillus aurantiobrunneus]